MRRTKNAVLLKFAGPELTILSQDHALDLFSSDAFLSINKRLLKFAGPATAIFLSNLIDKYKYFKYHRKDEAGWFFQTHEWQMEATGLTERSIRKCKKQLIAAKVLTTKWKGVPAKEWYKINVAQLIACVEKLEVYDKSVGLGMAKASCLGVAETSWQGVAKASCLVKETKGKETKGKETPSGGRVTTSMFDIFWKLYPKTKGSKGNALKKWRELCGRKRKDRPTWKTIESAILKQKETSRWKAGYITHPSTWLNQERWIDNPDDMTVIDFNDKPPPKVKCLLPPRIVKSCYDPALKLLSTSDNGILDLAKEAQLANNIYDILDWYTARQERPALKILNLSRIEEHAIYCKWTEIIPDEEEFLVKYIGWLEEQSWIDNINESAFLPTSKLLGQFRRFCQKKIGFDVFTGEAI